MQLIVTGLNASQIRTVSGLDAAQIRIVSGLDASQIRIVSGLDAAQVVKYFFYFIEIFYLCVQSDYPKVFLHDIMEGQICPAYSFKVTWFQNQIGILTHSQLSISNLLIYLLTTRR